MANYIFEFDPEKNALLRRERKIGFEEIIVLIESGRLLRVLEHPNKVKYPYQFIYEVDVGGYIYVVPFVKTGNRIFLKTIHRSRKATKKHRRGIYEEKN